MTLVKIGHSDIGSDLTIITFFLTTKSSLWW